MRQYAQEIGDRFVAALTRSYGDAYTFLRTRSNVARWSPEHIVVLRDRVEHAYQAGRISAETMEKACQLISSLVGDYDDPKTDEIAPARRRQAAAQARVLPAATTTTTMSMVSRSSVRPAVRHPSLAVDAEARDAAIQTVLLSEPARVSSSRSSPPAPRISQNPSPSLSPSPVSASPTKIVAGALLAQRYVLEKLIGIGGTALIYQARDLKAVGARASQRLAVKLLHPALQAQPSAVERFIDQFQQQQKLSHAGIARVFDLDVDAGSWFMTMELLEGETLLDRARQGLPRSEALRLVAACGDALIYAHQCGVVHGDLKPSNIFLTQSGSVRLLDFGGAAEPRAAEGDATGEDAGEATGARVAATPAYASPEVLAGERPTARDDIFSLACIAHELLTGQQRPRDGARAGRTVSAELSLRDSLALSRGMAWHRMDRPQSMAEFLRLLFAPQPPATVPIAVSHPADTAAATLGKRWQRHGRLLGFGLWGVGCLVALLSFTFGDPQPPRVAAGPTKAVAAVAAPQPGAAEPTTSAVTPPAVTASAPAPNSTPPSAMPGAMPSAMTPSASAPPAAAPPLETSPSTGSQVPSEPAATPAAPKKAAPSTQVTARRAATARVPVSTPAVSAAGSIGLERRQVLVSGRAVAAVITLKRTGNTNGRARVRWSTVPGTAKSAQHYRSASAVAEFADGQEIRTLFVPIVQQPSNRSARTFSVALERAPGGPPVGPVTKTTVTILGDI